MNSKNNNITFNNNIQKVNPQENSSYNKKLKKIMEKYKLSESKAEVVLNEVQKRKKLNLNEIYSEQKENIPIKEQEINSKTIKNEKQTYTEEKNLYENNSKTIEKNQKTTPNVDTILKEFINDYNDEPSIELKNVDLIFDVSPDRIDNLKEQFIRTMKRTKSKKVQFQALKNITFKINKGEKIGIIGYNGAGKSTLLKVITGIYPPTNGTIITHGNISPLLSLGAGFDYNYSGRENILLNGAVLGYDKEYLTNKIDEIIEFSELEEFIDLPIKNYSSGMLAKLGFSIATIVEPDILIIDEILGVGDVTFQRKSNDKMRSLMDTGTTVILVSHSIPQIRNLCDKAIWIDKGKVREIGEVNKVCDNYLKDSEKASKEELRNIKFK